jgi:protein-disulfide isomerase
MAAPRSGLNRFYLSLGVGALAGLGGLYYLVQRPKNVSIPANVEILAADTAGFQGYYLGSDSAKIEISEYADYQCPGCQQFESIQFPSVIQQLIQTGQVRWRYRDFPLEQHPHSRVAAHAAACGHEQGKFWEMKSLIFEHQYEWSPMRSAAAKFAEFAGQAGLDRAKYNDCMRSAKYAGRIQASLTEGMKLGVGSTPTFLIGGRLYPGAMPSDSIKALVQALQAATAR